MILAEAGDIQTQLQEKWLILWWALGVSLFALGIAWRLELFKPFQASSSPLIRGIDVLKGFGYFLFTELLLIPTLIGLVLNFKGYQGQEFIIAHPQAKGWFNLFIITGGFCGVLIAYLELSAIQRQQLWRQTTDSWLHNFGIGIASWFVIYPVVIAFSQMISLVSWQLFHHSFVEQIAVQNLRHTLANPLLFSLTALAVFILVPLTEEFLFRGLLQNWLKQKFSNSFAAIIVSSLVFTLFHYSSSHGVTNIELLSSLFLLSCMIGFIYERQRSLWAPVGLHGFFNLMSLIMLFQESSTSPH